MKNSFFVILVLSYMVKYGSILSNKSVQAGYLLLKYKPCTCPIYISLFPTNDKKFIGKGGYAYGLSIEDINVSGGILPKGI